MTITRVILGMLAGALVCPPPLHAQEADDEEPLSNLRIYQSLAGEIGDSVFAGVTIPESSAVAIRVEPEGSSWYIEEGVAQAVRRAGRAVADVPRAPYEARFGVALAGVEYFDIRRDGFFGPRIVDRSVTLVLNVQNDDSLPFSFYLLSSFHALEGFHGASDRVLVNSQEISQSDDRNEV